MTELDDQLDAIFAARDRDDMQPTIDAFVALLLQHPNEPRVVYEVGGSYDTAGEEQEAVHYYERALELGLAGELRRRCLMQYASTLRNLDRMDESLAVFDRAISEFGSSPALLVFKAVTLHAAGRVNEGFGLLMTAIADHADAPEVARYEASIRGYAGFIAGLPDPAGTD